MIINGFQKTTLLDYPEHLAATVFLGGCDFRCHFCHNASLVLRPLDSPLIPKEDILNYLHKRKNILEGVCISGGEPTLQKELPSFINEIKEIGLKVKLDTNGNNPTMLKHLADNNLIDYIAMDIKNSKEKYAQTIGIPNFNFADINESIDFLLNGSLPYEFRTTLVKEFHSLEDIIQIGHMIKGARVYFLQSFRDSEDVMKKGLTGFTQIELKLFSDKLSPFIHNVQIRGTDG